MEWNRGQENPPGTLQPSVASTANFSGIPRLKAARTSRPRAQKSFGKCRNCGMGAISAPESIVFSLYDHGISFIFNPFP